MPLIDSSYKAPKWILGKHSETIIPSLFRQVEGVRYVRERIPTEDGDFLDLDWSYKKGSSRLAILTHGLEGSTSSSYILGMVKKLNDEGWNVLAWNFRSCSGELNRKIHLYHAGSTGDLDGVVQYALKQKPYKELVLIGFSMGGNIVLNYLGKGGDKVASCLSKAVVFSVPCDLYSCVRKLSKGVNYVYLYNFLLTLKSKIVEKAKKFPELLSDVDLSKINSLIDFDNRFTAPLFGFKDAMHYYSECSSTSILSNIHHPCLIINAHNDPILDPSFSPIKECKNSKWVHLEIPSNGGHLGFMKKGINGLYWSEERALDFLRNRDHSV